MGRGRGSARDLLLGGKPATLGDNKRVISLFRRCREAETIEEFNVHLNRLPDDDPAYRNPAFKQTLIKLLQASRDLDKSKMLRTKLKEQEEIEFPEELQDVLFEYVLDKKKLGHTNILGADKLVLGMPAEGYDDYPFIKKSILSSIRLPGRGQEVWQNKESYEILKKLNNPINIPLIIQVVPRISRDFLNEKNLDKERKKMDNLVFGVDRGVVRHRGKKVWHLIDYKKHDKFDSLCGKYNMRSIEFARIGSWKEAESGRGDVKCCPKCLGIGKEVGHDVYSGANRRRREFARRRSAFIEDTINIKIEEHWDLVETNLCKYFNGELDFFDFKTDTTKDAQYFKEPIKETIELVFKDTIENDGPNYFWQGILDGYYDKNKSYPELDDQQIKTLVAKLYNHGNRREIINKAYNFLDRVENPDRYKPRVRTLGS